jgi:uncharacterized protein (DUF1501 family)
MTSKASRREFLHWSTKMAALGAGAPFALNLATIGAASAQTASDYKAIVCVFLFGGNDCHNTVVPYDTSSYDGYRTKRGAIARARADLLQLNPRNDLGGRQFALPKEIEPLHRLFGEGRVAIISNVGPLTQPTTRQQYASNSVPLPPKLFSHNDQQSTWQATVPEGAAFGWGGRIADILASSNQRSTFSSISVAGNAVWATGKSIQQYQVGPGGATAVNALDGGSLFGSGAAPQLLRKLITEPEDHILKSDHGRVVERALAANTELRAAMSGMPALRTAFPQNNSLAAQMKMVANLISVRDKLGAKRQVFFVSLGGFDHHANLTNGHPPLLQQVAQAMGAFDTAMTELQVQNQVTTFTASDFGRALLSNGDGSDHGWGGHHFVMGGAVQGQTIVGRMPVYATGTDEDAGNGRLIPTMAVDQYAAGLGRWLGLSDTQLREVLPNLGRFDGPASLLKA